MFPVIFGQDYIRTESKPKHDRRREGKVSSELETRIIPRSHEFLRPLLLIAGGHYLRNAAKESFPLAFPCRTRAEIADKLNHCFSETTKRLKNGRCCCRGQSK